MKSIFKAVFASLLLAVPALAQEVKVGDPEEKAITSTPGYIGAINRGGSKILYFKQGEITIVDGKVAKIGWRKPKSKNAALAGLVADPATDRAVRYAIGKVAGRLTEQDLQKVRKLELTPRTKQNLKARNLAGLEQAVNLTSLKATHNSLTNIQALKGLKKMHTLHLDGHQGGEENLGALESLAPIGTMYSLSRLYVSHYPVTNTADLVGLRYLRSLTARHCRIADISSLAGFKSTLSEVDLTGNQIEDLSGLAGLGKITKLTLSNNQISNLEPLAALTGLKELRMDNNAVADVAALAKLPNLEVISLVGNQIKNVDAFRDFPALKSLNIDGNPVDDITKLTGIIGLRWLSIQDTGLDIAKDSKQRRMVMGLRQRGLTVRFPQPPKEEESEDKKPDAETDDGGEATPKDAAEPKTK